MRATQFCVLITIEIWRTTGEDLASEIYVSPCGLRCSPSEDGKRISVIVYFFSFTHCVWGLVFGLWF